ncbi:MAG: AbrB/MazE/SpoVT family DNA-binding domain-containing protein [Candidatus Diapherotrites archaeon]
MEVSMTKVSSKGQVVIPLDIRKKANLKEGEKLLAYGEKDIIVLRKIGSSVAEFRQLASFGKAFAKRKQIKQSEVLADD